jgi:hypothetical protein
MRAICEEFGPIHPSNLCCRDLMAERLRFEPTLSLSRTVSPDVPASYTKVGWIARNFPAPAKTGLFS